MDRALHLAVDDQDVTSVQFLVKAGADVNKPGSDGYTAMDEIFLLGTRSNGQKQHKIVEILIDAGADVNRRIQ